MSTWHSVTDKELPSIRVKRSKTILKISLRNENVYFVKSGQQIYQLFAIRAPCTRFKAKPQQEKRLPSKLGSKFEGDMVEDFNKKRF